MYFYMWNEFVCEMDRVMRFREQLGYFISNHADLAIFHKRRC